MSTIDLSSIDSRIKAVESSYHRQLNQAGKPGYDPALTIDLKKDLDWWTEQKRGFRESPRQYHTNTLGQTLMLSTE
jgi:hypothetical protein